MVSEIGSELAKRVKATVEHEKQQKEIERQRKNGTIDLLNAALQPIVEGFNKEVEPSLQITLTVDGRYLLFRRKKSTILWVDIGASSGYFGKYGPQIETDRTYFTIGNGIQQEPLFQCDSPWHLPDKYAAPFDVEQFALLLCKEALELNG